MLQLVISKRKPQSVLNKAVLSVAKKMGGCISETKRESPDYQVKSATWINTKVTKTKARHEMKRDESGTKEQEKQTITKLKIVL